MLPPAFLTILYNIFYAFPTIIYNDFYAFPRIGNVILKSVEAINKKVYKCQDLFIPRYN